MGGVVQSEANSQDEDDGGRDLYGQAHEVGTSGNIQQSEDHTEEHEATDNYICYQE